jgi:hypothetical protein
MRDSKNTREQVMDRRLRGSGHGVKSDVKAKCGKEKSTCQKQKGEEATLRINPEPFEF